MKKRHGDADNKQSALVNALEMPVFASRWLQAPLYFGLIVAQCVYVYKFMIELMHLITGAPAMKEADVMLMVLGLVDVVMVDVVRPAAECRRAQGRRPPIGVP